MPLDVGTAGGNRAALAAALAALTKRYAGSDVGSAEQPFVPRVPQLPLPPGIVPTAAAPGTPGAPAMPIPGGGAGGPLGPYNTAGDGGAWAANGVNLYNPNLARGDMPAPGPVGVGPGNWSMDNFGTPFWRQDWEFRPGQGYVIKGSSW